jgi:hypothetical protein
MSALVIEEDLDAPPGHALLRLHGAGAGEDARFRLLRPAKELGHLGPSGWQTEPALLTPLSVSREGEETVLRVGPDVVDQIAVDDQVRIEVPGLGFTGEDYWPDIPPSSGGLAAGYVDVARPVGAGGAAPPPWHQVKRTADTETSAGADDTGSTPAGTAPPTAAPTTRGDGGGGGEDDADTGAPAPIGDPSPGGSSPERRRNRLPLLLAGLFAVVVAAGAGFFIADPFGMFAAEPVARTPTPEPDEQAPTDTEAEPAPAAVACSEDTFAGLLADGGDLAAWQEAAAGCRGADDPAAYVAALDSCVAQGRAPCLYQMARCYDPRHADELRCAPGGEPSIERAIDYYARAADAELAAATGEHAALCERLSGEDAEAAFLAGCD